MNDLVKQMLKEWNDPQGARTMSEAEELIDALQIEIAELTEFRDKAFDAHPNIDLDIQDNKVVT